MCSPRPKLRLLAGRLLLGLVVLLALAACATGPRVRTDFDPEADFARYRSYAFYQPLAMDKAGYSSYMTDRIRAAIRREMDARGYIFNEGSPDIRVNFQGIVQDKTDVYSSPYMDFPYFYGPRARGYYGYYGGYPGWGFYDGPQVTHYREGTVTMDLVDAARSRLIWSGSASGRVTQKTPQARAAEVDRAIGAIFMQFPYRAGSSQVDLSKVGLSQVAPAQ